MGWRCHGGALAPVLLAGCDDDGGSARIDATPHHDAAARIDAAVPTTDALTADCQPARCCPTRSSTARTMWWSPEPRAPRRRRRRPVSGAGRQPVRRQHPAVSGRRSGCPATPTRTASRGATGRRSPPDRTPPTSRAVIGDYVYRGGCDPDLVGTCFYADACKVTSFGQDAAGELYIMDRTKGRFFHIAAGP